MAAELQQVELDLKSFNPDMLRLLALLSNRDTISSFENMKEKQSLLKNLTFAEKSNILQTSLNILTVQSQVKKESKCFSAEWFTSIDEIIQNNLESKNNILIFYLNARQINRNSSTFSDYHKEARSKIDDFIENKFIAFLKRFGFQQIDKWYHIPKSSSVRDRDFFGCIRIINPKIRLINAMNDTKTIKKFFRTDILNHPGQKCLNIIFARTFPKIDYIPIELLQSKSIQVYQIYKKMKSKYHLRNVTKRLHKQKNHKKVIEKIKMS